MSVIDVIFLDEVHLYVESFDPDIEEQLAELFRFDTHQAIFKENDDFAKWDGVYRLYDPDKNKRNLYTGLFSRLEKFAEENGYTILRNRAREVRTKNKYPVGATMESLRDYEDFYGEDIHKKPIDDEEKFRATMETWEVNPEINKLFDRSAPFYSRTKAQQHEITAIINALNRRRAVLWFKSENNKHLVMCFLLQRYIQSKKTCLFMVSNKMVVDRLYEGFRESFSKEGEASTFYIGEHIQKLYTGLSKEVSNRVILANWESVKNQPSKWFDQFSVVIVDEINKFHSRSLISLMEKITKTKTRIGIMDSTENLKIHRLVFEGLFGPVEEVWDKTNSIEYQSDLKVTCLRLNYPNAIKEARKGNEQHEEVKFLQQYDERNRYIRNLACTLEGNTLVLVMNTDHGNILHNLIREKLQQDGLKKDVFMSVGQIGKEDEKSILLNIKESNEWIIIASYRRIDVGFMIHSLDNVVMASPYKNDIRNLRAIGSGLTSRNATCNLYDFMDDLRIGEWENHLIKQADKRMTIYEEEKKRGLSLKEVSVNIRTPAKTSKMRVDR